MYLRSILTLLMFVTAGFVQPTIAEHTNALDKALAAQSDEHKARYDSRHPKETLEFFGIEPGMKVGEALPGGGWYSKILLAYLGGDGHLVGIDYPIQMYAEWGPDSFVTPAFLKEKENWPDTWTATAKGWNESNSTGVSAATFSTMPAELDGTLDAVLFIRALHNMSRFNSKGGYLNDALAATYKAIKPGGIVGVVQHLARDDRSDEWANGSSGYLKRAFIVEQFTNAGFELAGESTVNNNELDQAKEGDVVWRLPPSLRGAKEDEELAKAMRAIGESNRVTLKFIKPAE